MGAIDREAVADFVLVRRKRSGGFGATPHLPATVEDTFHALAVLRILAEATGQDALLDECRADSSLRAYLARLLPGQGYGLKTIFQLLTACAFLGVPVDGEQAKRTLETKVGRAPSLADRYYAVRICGETLDCDLHAALGPEQAGNRPPARKTSEEMMMHLAVATALENDGADTAGLAAWFRRCQNPDGGFGFFPGTTSFIENCHFCLLALAGLDARPGDAAGAAAFMAGCQTKAGGFGRKSNAAPFLDATWHAVAGLALLEESLPDRT